MKVCNRVLPGSQPPSSHLFRGPSSWASPTCFWGQLSTSHLSFWANFPLPSTFEAKIPLPTHFFLITAHLPIPSTIYYYQRDHMFPRSLLMSFRSSWAKRSVMTADILSARGGTAIPKRWGWSTWRERNKKMY